jgi:hypothetical protein
MKAHLLDDLRWFLSAAKQSTYAAQGDKASVSPLLAGSKQLECSDGPFAYRDIYFGMTRFAGQETVAHNGRVTWSMTYAGGVDTEVAPAEVPAIYTALRKALLQPRPDVPVRGPARLKVDPFDYACAIIGDLTAFAGNETIVMGDRRVYTLYFSGGLIT